MVVLLHRVLHRMRPMDPLQPQLLPLFHWDCRDAYERETEEVARMPRVRDACFQHSFFTGNGTDRILRYGSLPVYPRMRMSVSQPILHRA